MSDIVQNTNRDFTLSGNAWLRFIVIGFMYFSQGLPLGLFGVAIPTYLAETGDYDKAEIAQFLTFISLPWALKFLAGPLMDRFAFLIYGHRRPWVVIAQAGLTISFAISAVAGGGELNLVSLAACGFLLNIFSSSQDVAVDGLAIGVLKERERSSATALMFGSQRIGNLAGAVGGGLMLGRFGVTGACLVAAVTTFLIMMIPLNIKERTIEKRFPWSSGSIAPEILAMKVEDIAGMFVDILKALAVPVSLFFMIASFCDSAAGGLLGAYLPSFSVIDLGWDDGTYNAWYSTILLIAAGVGLLMSPLFDKFGQRKCILVLCVVTAIGIVAFLLVPALQEGRGWHVFMLLFWVSQHLFAILIISACMELVTPRIAASQFAIYMSIANLSSTVGNSIIGLYGETWSVETILYLTAALVVVAPVFFWLTGLGVRDRSTPTSEHQVA